MTIQFRAKHKSGFTVESPLKPFTFPAGEAHIKIPETFKFEDYDHHIAVITGHDPQDLFHLSMWAQVLDTDPNSRYSVILPYLPAARADRGYPNLWTYVRFIIDQIGPENLVTIDPHSAAWLETYDALDEFGTKLITYPVARIIKHHVQDGSSDSKAQPYVGVIAPDKGAHDRAAAAARVMGVPVYQAGKKRDEATGKLSGFHMEDELPAEGKLLIVDDICDGGGTFLGLAEATGLPKDRVDLWVTHGIFSKGVHVLAENFGIVHTTDSFYTGESFHLQDEAHDGKAAIDFEVKVHPILGILETEVGR